MLGVQNLCLPREAGPGGLRLLPGRSDSELPLSGPSSGGGKFTVKPSLQRRSQPGFCPGTQSLKRTSTCGDLPLAGGHGLRQKLKMDFLVRFCE